MFLSIFTRSCILSYVSQSLSFAFLIRLYESLSPFIFYNSLRTSSFAFVLPLRWCVSPFILLEFSQNFIFCFFYTSTLKLIIIYIFRFHIKIWYVVLFEMVNTYIYVDGLYKEKILKLVAYEKQVLTFWFISELEAGSHSLFSDTILWPILLISSSY